MNWVHPPKWFLVSGTTGPRHTSETRQGRLRVAPQTRPNEQARAKGHRSYSLLGRQHLIECYFNVLSGTKAAAFLGSATASFSTLKTRWSIGEDATKSA